MGGGIGMVVEYLGDSISKKLLSKFPHYNINIDFDHSQSSIWSPLVHPYLPPLSFHSHHYQDDDDDVDDVDESKMNKKIFKSPAGNNTIVQNLNTRFRNLMKQSSNKTMMKQKQKKKKKNISARLFNFSPVPLAAMAAASTPTPKKRWNKILKVASKGFKKTSKKKDRGAHIALLSNCLVNAMV